MLTDSPYVSSRIGDRTVALGLLFAVGATMFAPQWVLSVTPNCLISRVLGGGVCWGCGITRAVIALAHLNFEAATAANPLVYVVAPCLGWIIFKFVRLSFRT